jgi:hypothetical protein
MAHPHVTQREGFGGQPAVAAEEQHNGSYANPLFSGGGLWHPYLWAWLRPGTRHRTAEGIRRAIELKWVPVDWAIQVFALLAWALWTYLLLAVILRIAGRLELRLSSAGRLWAASEAVTWSPVKLAVDLVVGAALMSSAMSEGSIQAEALKQQPGWSSTIAPHVATMREVDERSHEPGTTRTETPPTNTSEVQGFSSKGGNGTYIVRAGDSLWSIAESKLDDPYRWTTIWQLNQGREMPDGERLLRPGYIRPGWRLRLPGVERQSASPHAKDDQRLEARSGKSKRPSVSLPLSR